MSEDMDSGQRRPAAQLQKEAGSSAGQAASGSPQRQTLEGLPDGHPDLPTPSSAVTVPSGPESGAEQQRKIARQLWGPVPTKERLEAYFKDTQKQERDRFRDRWGFDTSTGKPLPEPENRTGWKWELLSGEQDSREGIDTKPDPPDGELRDDA